MAQSFEGGYGRSIAADGIRAEGTLGPKLVTANRGFRPALTVLAFKGFLH
jgi:hypothetical protein